MDVCWARGFPHPKHGNRRRSANLTAKEQSFEAIMLAAVLDVRRTGKMDATNIVKELSLAFPRRVVRIKKVGKFLESKP